MKRTRKIFLALTMMLFTTLLINTTNAKYNILEFGDIGNVRFTKYTTYTDEFVVENNDLKDKDDVKSDNLWGADVPEQNVNLNNYGPDYKIEMLEKVAFSARNATNNDSVVTSFEFMIYTFPNSDFTLEFTLINTAIASSYQEITGSVVIKGTNVSSYQFNDPSTPNAPFNLEFYNYVETRTVNSDGTVTIGKNNKFYTIIVKVNPILYYERVTISGNNGNYTLNNTSADTNNGVKYINPTEKEVLENFYVMDPGEAHEFNIQVNVTGKGNGSGAKSIYSTIKMHAIRYNSAVINA